MRSCDAQVRADALTLNTRKPGSHPAQLLTPWLIERSALPPRSNTGRLFSIWTWPQPVRRKACMNEEKLLAALLIAVNEAESWYDDDHGYCGRLDSLKPCYEILDAFGLKSDFEKEQAPV